MYFDTSVFEQASAALFFNQHPGNQFGFAFFLYSEKLDYDETMVEKFDAIHGQPWKLRDILPKVLNAGECGGTLTAEGAAFLDTYKAAFAVEKTAVETL